MKNIFIIALIIASLFSLKQALGQAPQLISYQAVIRDASNNLLTNQVVGIQISIIQGNVTNPPIYTETHAPTTNDNGLVSIEIGNGTTTDNFSSIQWGTNSPYFIQTEIDPTGGTSYTITSSSQLLSVPYAFHANTADSIIGGVTSTEEDNFYLGQDTLGGIVYYLYKDADGDQHGLIVNQDDSLINWQSVVSSTGGNLTYDGVFNTNLMINSPAADYVNNLSNGGFTDWYLPSIDELILLFNSRFITNRSLVEGGYTPLFQNLYWSSTSFSTNDASTFCFITAVVASNIDKTSFFLARAIRTF